MSKLIQLARVPFEVKGKKGYIPGPVLKNDHQPLIGPTAEQRKNRESEQRLTGQLSSVGVPMTWKIRATWSTSLTPGNSGLRHMSSAKMHPTLTQKCRFAQSRAAVVGSMCPWLVVTARGGDVVPRPDRFSKLNYSTTKIVLKNKNGGFGNVSPRALRRRSRIFPHPLGCGASEL